jgi:hypothetical protein
MMMVIFLILLIFDHIFKYRFIEMNGVVYNKKGIERSIVFREHRPQMSIRMLPTDSAIWRSDNLEEKYYDVECDENGFIEPGTIHKRPDLSMIFLGGSTTECGFNEDQMRFPYVTGRLIEKDTGMKVNSLNAGKNDNNSFHSINVLTNKLIPLEPDIVVLMHNCNDVGTLSVNGNYWKNDGSFPAIVPKEGKSPVRMILKGVKDLMFPNLFDACKILIARPASRKSMEYRKNFSRNYMENQAVAVEIDIQHYQFLFRRNLLNFIDLCRNSEIIPVLMTQVSRLTREPDETVLKYHADLVNPLVYNLPLTYMQYYEMHSLFNDTIRSVAEEQDVTLVDLDSTIPKNKQYMYDAFHFSEQGSRLVAETITDHLHQLLGSTGIIPSRGDQTLGTPPEGIIQE